MKAAAIILICGLAMSAASQAQRASAAPPAETPSPGQRIPVMPDLNSVLADLQRATMSADANIARLHIDKWKADSSQKQQMQQVANSLRRNITTAVPGLITDVQSSKGGVSATFKLYHNINVVYEFLNSLAEAAGAFGKKDEYEPLASDASALDNARQNLSTYIEQAASGLEQKQRQAAAAAAAAAQAPPKPVVISDDDQPKPKAKPASARKKKTSAVKPKPSPTPTPAPQ